MLFLNCNLGYAFQRGKFSNVNKDWNCLSSQDKVGLFDLINNG